MGLKPSLFKRFSAALLLLFCLSAMQSSPDLIEMMNQSQQILNTTYALDVDKFRMKKADIQLTKDGFFRCRRTSLTGKQEYFSFSFSDFAELDYLGNTQNGWVVLKTKPESIIVQTFRDPKGNIDTMASELRLPFKTLATDDLQQLNDCFERIRERLKN